MIAAFYKSTRPGLQGIYSRAVRLWMRGPYSHVEIIFDDGLSASSSFVDGGVRFKKIDFNPSHWDFIELKQFNEQLTKQWFYNNLGKKYDVLGNIGFVARAVSDDKNKWFCSEAVAASLGFTDAWRYCPNTLYSALKLIEAKNV